MIEIKAYECGHCRKIYRSIRGVTRHEKYCHKNPENNFTCGLCKHFVEEEVMRPSVYDSEQMERRKRLFCSKFNKVLYSAGMEGKGYLKRYPASFVDAMKMTYDCKEFEGKWQ